MTMTEEEFESEIMFLRAQLKDAQKRISELENGFPAKLQFKWHAADGVFTVTGTPVQGYHWDLPGDEESLADFLNQTHNFPPTRTTKLANGWQVCGLFQDPNVRDGPIHGWAYNPHLKEWVPMSWDSQFGECLTFNATDLKYRLADE